MALGVNDILDFIQSWRGNNGLADDIKLVRIRLSNL